MEDHKKVVNGNIPEGDGKCLNSTEVSANKVEDSAAEDKAENCDAVTNNTPDSAAEAKTEDSAAEAKTEDSAAEAKTEDSAAEVKGENGAADKDAKTKEREFIVKIRGLTSSSTKEDIVKFFSDSKIKGELNGIHLTSFRSRRPNGSAYIEFETLEDLDNALEKDNHYIGDRYIEVFRCKKREMRAAKRRMRNDSEKEVSGDTCVRLRGVPYECSKEEISHFFAGLQIVRNGITLPLDSRGRSTGEAFVQFASEDVADKAMAKHKEKLGHRYIEIFRSSLQEIRNVSGLGPMRMRNMDSDRFHPYDQVDMLGPGRRHGMSMEQFGGRDEYMAGVEHRIRMTGVPYKAKKRDIADFFKPLKPISINILYEPNGRPCGEADVEFHSHREALKAMKKHRSKLLHRFIRLYLFSERKPFRREIQPYGPENGHCFETSMDMEMSPIGGQMGYCDLDRRFDDRRFEGYRYNLDRRFEGAYGGY